MYLGRGGLKRKRMRFPLAAKCKTEKFMCLCRTQRRMKQRGKVFFLFSKLGTGVKQRALSDWHIQRVPCQSSAQSISSSQSVLFVCWICFGTCRPLIDMGAGAGKTLLLCEANGPSVTRPQMFGLRRYTDIIMVQKSGHLLSFSLSLSLSLSLFFRSLSLVHAAVKHSDFFPLNYQLSWSVSYQQGECSSPISLRGRFT